MGGWRGRTSQAEKSAVAKNHRPVMDWLVQEGARGLLSLRHGERGENDKAER